MSVREVRPDSGRVSNPHDDNEDERRRLSVFDLVGLAAGGVIGSGWLFGGAKAYATAGIDAVWAWAIGGAVMLVIAVVMVELATVAPKTGGLIFLPLQSSGPLVATVVAAALWIFYALNSASEATAMAKGLGLWVPNLYRLPAVSCDPDPFQDMLTGKGLIYATAFMALILAVNLLAPRVFVKINFFLTLWKVLIPVLIVVLLIASGFDDDGPTAPCRSAGNGFNALAAVIGSGVIYAYTGFQGPLDFAGNVKRQGIGEAARLRWAVYGTIVGSIVFYISLQIVFNGRGWDPGRPDSPYTQFAIAASMGWFAPFIKADALLSPMGSGLVFTHALTREVAALSRAHLTHRGLQTARNASIKLRRQRIDVYWMVLLVDFAVGWIALAVVGGSWGMLTAIISVMTLVVYAMPGVVLVSLRDPLQDRLPAYSDRRAVVHRILAEVSFVSIALILYWAGWADLWPGMAAVAVGCILLLGLPILAHRDLPGVGRFLRRYDAKGHATLLRQWRTNPAAGAATWLLGYLAVLTLLRLLEEFSGLRGKPWSVFLSLVVAGTAIITFEYLVAMSKRYMNKVPPTLPVPSNPSPSGG